MSSIKCDEMFTSGMRGIKSKTLEYNKDSNNIKIEHKFVKTSSKEEIYTSCKEFNLAEKNENLKIFNDDTIRKDFQNLMWNIKI